MKTFRIIVLDKTKLSYLSLVGLVWLHDELDRCLAEMYRVPQLVRCMMSNPAQIMLIEPFNENGSS